MGYAANTLFGGVPGNQSGTAPMSSAPQTPTVPSGSEVNIGAKESIIDGTPLRVVTLVVLAVGGLAGLKWAGFKFNITVGG
jgi:hypothetical protein